MVSHIARYINQTPERTPVVSPDVVRMRCLLRHGAGMLTAFALPAHRALQPDLLPEPMHALVIHFQSVTSKQGKRTPVTVAFVSPGNPP